MSNETTLSTALQQQIDAVPALFPATPDAVESVLVRAKQMSIASPEDKTAIELVGSVRKYARDLRLRVEKARKERKAGALAYGRAIDECARALRGPLEDAEAHCKHELKKVEMEIARRESAKIDQRIAELAAVGVQIPRAMVEAVDDEGWDAFLEEQARLAEERKRLKEEREELARQRAEMERERTVAAEAQAELRAEEPTPLAEVSEREACGLPPSSSGGLLSPEGPAEEAASVLTRAERVEQAAQRLREHWHEGVDRALNAHLGTTRAAHALFAELESDVEGTVET